VGTSGCGKTTLLLNLILKEWGISFFICTYLQNHQNKALIIILKKTYEKLSVQKNTEIVHFLKTAKN